VNRASLVKDLMSIAFLIIFTKTGLAGTCPATGLEIWEGLCNTHIPILQWETPNYMIRIDDLGHSRYRYAAWDSDQSQSSEPNIILTDGHCIQDGTCGNHHYEFNNSGYTYYVEVLIVSEGPLGFLRVLHEGRCILEEQVVREVYENFREAARQSLIGRYGS
jgi:hypothetical protein